MSLLERHEVLRGGHEANRDWWYSTKLGLAIAGALVAPYAVHATLL